MLLCNCFERDASRAGISYHSITDDPEDEPYEDEALDADWFMKQSCQTCGNAIRSRSHALRRPLVGGGWQGCYCSIGCLKDALSPDDLTNGVTKLLVKRVLEQIEAIGILNRIPDPLPAAGEEEEEQFRRFTARLPIVEPEPVFPTRDEFEQAL
jgi:hypothetical protein